MHFFVQLSSYELRKKMHHTPIRPSASLDFVHFSAKRLKGQDIGDVQEHARCPGLP